MSKILHIIPTYLPATHASGPIIPTYYLNKRLVEKGQEITVYTTNTDGFGKLNVPVGKEVIRDGVRTYYFPVSFPSQWLYSPEMARMIEKNISGFDLVHITSVFLPASAIGSRYARKFNKPYMISPHGSLMKEPLARKFLKKKIYISLIEKGILKNAAAVHFLVDKEKDEYLAAGLPLKKAVVIPNGIDKDSFDFNVEENFFRDKFGIGKDKKMVLFLARLHPIKGLDTLLPAFAQVVEDEPRALLILAGPDEDGYKKKLIELVDKYELKNCVKFTGSIFGKEKVGALRESNLFVLPSYTEACSMATIEASYFGLPIVTTKNSGLAPLISQYSAGFVVNKNENELAGAILKLLKNSELADRMSQAAKTMADNEFSIDKTSDRFVSVYDELIGKS